MMTAYITICYDVESEPYSLGVFSSYERAKSAVDDYFDDKNTEEDVNDYDKLRKMHYIIKYNNRYDTSYEIKIIEATLDTPLS